MASRTQFDVMIIYSAPLKAVSRTEISSLQFSASHSKIEYLREKPFRGTSNRRVSNRRQIINYLWSNSIKPIALKPYWHFLYKLNVFDQLTMLREFSIDA